MISKTSTLLIGLGVQLLLAQTSCVWINPADWQQRTDLDEDGYGAQGAGGDDCDDGDALTFPGAGRNEADKQACMRDADGDGYGDPTVSDGVAAGTDCDDTDGRTFPGAGRNEADAQACMRDVDGDGYGEPEVPADITPGTDCDDGDAAVTFVADDPDCDGVLTPAAGGRFLKLPAGSFEMGCTAGQQDCDDNEFPVHTVTLTHAFWLGETEATRGQFAAVGLVFLGWDKFEGCDSDCPAAPLSWCDGTELANELSDLAGLERCYAYDESWSPPCRTMLENLVECEGYRLPTEAEWEYAARAGTDLLYAGSNTLSASSCGEQPCPVASTASNGWGLVGMSTNVAEWTQDRFGMYPGGSVSDPLGPLTGERRVYRGGDFHIDYHNPRVACRRSFAPVPDGWEHPWFLDAGVRLARTVP